MKHFCRPFSHLEVSYPPGRMDLYDAAHAIYQHITSANRLSRWSTRSVIDVLDDGLDRDDLADVM